MAARSDRSAGLSLNVILRETNEQARRFFDEGVKAGTVQMAADRSEHLSDTNKARYKRYNDRGAASAFCAAVQLSGSSAITHNARRNWTS